MKWKLWNRHPHPPFWKFFKPFGKKREFVPHVLKLVVNLSCYFSFAAFSSSWWSCPGQPEKGSSLLRSKIGSIKNISIMKLKKLGHFIEDNFFLYFVTTPSLVAAANLKIPSENGKEKNQTWLVCNSMFKIISIILAPKWNRCFFYTF